MGIIKNEEIVGYIIDQQCVCRDCVLKDEEKELTIEELITSDDLEHEDRYFCDRCHTEIR